MHYLGGKYRIGKDIARYIQSVRSSQVYFEPFVGGAWVLQEVGGCRIASDINDYLIDMYIALQDGWIPPDIVSEELYNEYKMNPKRHDPLTAFIGIGCSYSGKWFGGYARSGERNYALNAKRSLLKKLQYIRNVHFMYGAYDTFNPSGMVIYCDPPYAGMTSYDACEKFDHEVFWKIMRVWSGNNIVIVSEYDAPKDWGCVAKMRTKTDLHTSIGKEERVEKVFRLRCCCTPEEICADTMVKQRKLWGV